MLRSVFPGAARTRLTLGSAQLDATLVAENRIAGRYGTTSGTGTLQPGPAEVTENRAFRGRLAAAWTFHGIATWIESQGDLLGGRHPPAYLPIRPAFASFLIESIVSIRIQRMAGFVQSTMAGSQ